MPPDTTTGDRLVERSGAEAVDPVVPVPAVLEDAVPAVPVGAVVDELVEVGEVVVGEVVADAPATVVELDGADRAAALVPPEPVEAEDEPPGMARETTIPMTRAAPAAATEMARELRWTRRRAAFLRADSCASWGRFGLMGGMSSPRPRPSRTVS